MTVHRMMYTSLAIKNMLKPDLYIILRKARINNKTADITGLLVYVDNIFLQILEGNRTEVLKLFSTISKDPRHTEVKIIHEDEAEKRVFPSWQMAYASPSAKELATWSGLNSTTTLQDTLEAMNKEPSRISEVLSKLLEQAADT
jgi:hypothetical protein